MRASDCACMCVLFRMCMRLWVCMYGYYARVRVSVIRMCTICAYVWVYSLLCVCVRVNVFSIAIIAIIIFILNWKSQFNLIIPNSKLFIRFSYLLEGNLQQYSVSTVCSTYAAFNSL